MAPKTRTAAQQKPTNKANRDAATPTKRAEPKLLTPSKRTPVKRLDHPIVTEQDILAAHNNQQLVEFINSLTNTKQDQIFSKYQQKVQQQLDSDHELITSLSDQVSEKQTTIDHLLEEIRQLKAAASKPNLLYQPKDIIYESPIRKKKSPNGPAHLIGQDDLSRELENIGFTLDMVELLTGVRVTNFHEDDDQFYFEIKQKSVSDLAFINYRLEISKSFEATAEISYVPTFLDALEKGYKVEDDSDEIHPIENARYLKSILPEYLCESLSFPYNTLAQFYGKISRALNKRK